MNFDYYIDDNDYINTLLNEDLFKEGEDKINKSTLFFINEIRNTKKGIGSINDLLSHYGLDTQEGLALMALAEAMLRIPDKKTADDLLESKLQEIDTDQLPETHNPLIKALSWGMGIAQKIVHTKDSPKSFIKAAIQKLGIPCVRTATYQMIKMMSNHFILGETIQQAAKEAYEKDLHSFDMLGEGARTKQKAKEYYDLYYKAIDHISKFNKGKNFTECQSVSIKISALHPKFFPIFKESYFDEIYNLVLSLVSFAHEKNVPVTIDAEEADRLEFTILLLERLIKEKRFQGWNAIGLVVQAYQKRALSVIEYIISLAKKHQRIIPVRLVKGAYWDSEIKKAQEKGLKDFPVFTRKSATDLHYLHCAKKLLDHRDVVYPQTATHNALTVAQLIELAGNSKGWEIQRLHGMGAELFDIIAKHYPDLNRRIYAPVGEYKDLLSYLVRRLLENGANSSFMNALNKKDIPAEHFLKKPHELLHATYVMRHPGVRLPAHIFPTHTHAKGFEFGYSEDYDLLKLASEQNISFTVPLKTEYSSQSAASIAITSPINKRVIGHVIPSDLMSVSEAIEKASEYFNIWEQTSIQERKEIFLNISDKIEENILNFIPYLIQEAGKTIEDALNDIREGIDFCRYYAYQAEEDFDSLHSLPSPNGEKNVYFYAPRGVFACISPWNFPFAIYIGQIAAALLAGNTVVAKPAEQTPIISIKLREMMIEAGLPKDAFHLVIGDHVIGQALTQNPDIAGIVFTGSTAVANSIYQSMAGSNLAIRPLIAETGGLNALIADSTALLEQLIDDVLKSAFQSAGQRCSALRLLLVQEDIADTLLDMLAQATSEMSLGDPSHMATEIGPVIDQKAYDKLNGYIQKQKNIIYDGKNLLENIPEQGTYIPPTIIKLETLEDFNDEIFGPVLHVLSYKKDNLDSLLQELNKKGYGLTMGVHSRIPEFVEHVTRIMRVGNIYINRNIIGAVVGSQPFGGYGKSGTGPKAGGPDYLKKFTYERVISTNIAAAGGDPELMAIENI